MREQGYILPKSYRLTGWGFFILSILVLAIVFYLIWARVTITIFPNTETINQEFIFDVKEGLVIQPLATANEIAGKIRAVDLAGSSTFEASGSKTFESAIVGEVTIINNYSQDQNLVETTRLANPDNPDKVLVRLNKTIVVPAGGQIKVQVYPDDSENFVIIEPGRLIIPGLWGPLQDKIYAEVTEDLTKGARTISVVTQADLDQAELDLKEQLYQQALLEVNQGLEPQEILWPKLFSSQVDELNFDVEVGQEVAEFTTQMKLKAVVVVFDESQLISLARNKLKASLPSDQQLVSLDPKNFSYVIEKYNLDTRQANIKAVIKGNSILANTANLLDKSNLVGLTEQQVKDYFADFAEIKKVEVKFQPAWLKKTPRIKEKIEIEIAGN